MLIVTTANGINHERCFPERTMRSRPADPTHHRSAPTDQRHKRLALPKSLSCCYIGSKRCARCMWG